ncbi:S8 family serine peptidase [Sedimentibacter sp. zth1]|uniref:S8 family peptidase n=1 Tax=Sedimentibacter sp. zth1 TaxID=2816908 RepID=UPI001A9167E8|nr:S8 family serine peptidase [Sedimentibacter sp. zth1]QSX06304.1 S8 family serine peptidase [Sedimentibacter sp. zth1]
MKKFFSVVVSLLLLFSLVNCQTAFANSFFFNSQDKVENELIICFEAEEEDGVKAFNSTSAIDEQEAALKSLGLEVKGSVIKSLNDSNDRMGIFEDKTEEVLKSLGSVFLVKYDSKNYFTSKRATSGIKKQLEKKGYKIKYVEQNYIYKALNVTQDYNISSYTLNPNQAWHYEMINVPQAWETTVGSPNVKIAILDTGIDYNHDCLSNFVDLNLSTSYVNDSPMDDHSHGTHVAGTIASYGSVSGVMRNASLIAVKVLDSSGSGSTYDIQEAIIYAANCNADAINMSLGGGSYAQSMQDACTYAINQGTVVVAATGNSGTSTVSYPAKYDGVIGVGNVQSDGTRASSSQYGEGLDIMAPGTYIYSTVPNNSFAFYSGTSMATPHVCGVVGLMRAANPDATVAEICDAIFETGQYAGSSYEYGNGIIDANACVDTITGTPVDPPEEKQLSVSTEYSSTRSKIYQYITVKDENNNVVIGATVNVEITCPNGSIINKNLTTDSNGVASNSINARSNGYGTYTYNVTVSKIGYTTIAINESYEF